MKNIRGVFLIPVLIIYVLIPFVLAMTMKKYEDIRYVEENFILITQYFVPVLSVWWISFAFIELVEGEGNELHFINHRMKDNLVLLWLALYLILLAMGCGAASMWMDNVFLEFLRMAICSCFYVGLIYAVMFWSGSMTLSFLTVILYWMSSTFGSQIPVAIFNCYDTDPMSMELLSKKYVYIMLFAIALYVTGCMGNFRKQKYNG